MRAQSNAHIGTTAIYVPCETCLIQVNLSTASQHPTLSRSRSPSPGSSDGSRNHPAGDRAFLNHSQRESIKLLMVSGPLCLLPGNNRASPPTPASGGRGASAGPRSPDGSERGQCAATTPASPEMATPSAKRVNNAARIATVMLKKSRLPRWFLNPMNVRRLVDIAPFLFWSCRFRADSADVKPPVPNTPDDDSDW